jgi:hypothetical protein
VPYVNYFGSGVFVAETHVVERLDWLPGIVALTLQEGGINYVRFPLDAPRPAALANLAPGDVISVLKIPQEHPVDVIALKGPAGEYRQQGIRSREFFTDMMFLIAALLVFTLLFGGKPLSGFDVALLTLFIALLSCRGLVFAAVRRRNQRITQFLRGRLGP